MFNMFYVFKTNILYAQGLKYYKVPDILKALTLGLLLTLKGKKSAIYLWENYITKNSTLLAIYMSV